MKSAHPLGLAILAGSLMLGSIGLVSAQTTAPGSGTAPAGAGTGGESRPDAGQGGRRDAAPGGAGSARGGAGEAGQRGDRAAPGQGQAGARPDAAPGRPTAPTAQEAPRAGRGANEVPPRERGEVAPRQERSRTVVRDRGPDVRVRGGGVVRNTVVVRRGIAPVRRVNRTVIVDRRPAVVRLRRARVVGLGRVCRVKVTRIRSAAGVRVRRVRVCSRR